MERFVHGGDRYRNDIIYDFSINISPLGIPKKVMEALQNCVSEIEAYPDPFAEQLKEKVAEKRKIQKDTIVFGNGASELIYAIIRAVRPKRAWIPIPSFTEYERALQAYGTEIEFFLLPEKKDFVMGNEFVKEIFKRKEKQNRDEREYSNFTNNTKKTDTLPDIIFICNPNNPNGKLIPVQVLKQLMEVCKEQRIYLVVDECFLELSGAFAQSIVSDTSENPYLFILDAFTKTYAMPGIRLGVGYSSNKSILENMQLQMPQWNVSSIAQLAGIKALEEEGYIEKAVSMLEIERNWMMEQLKGLGCQVFHSDANYILFKSERDWKALLLKQGILIRDCNNYRGLQKGFYRVAVQTREKNEYLIQAMRQLNSDLLKIEELKIKV